MSSYRRRLLLANQLEENIVLYGNSVQDGTPTPEAPIDIMSLENPVINVNGNEYLRINENTSFSKNLLKPLNTITENKKFTYDASSGDGTIVVTGMGDATLTSSTSVCYLNSNLDDLLIDGETYTMALNLEKQNPLSLLIQLKNKSTGKYSYLSANKYTSRVINFTVDKSTYSYTHMYLQIAPQEQEQSITAQPILAIGRHTELPFEPYIPPITSMHGIGSYRDKIYTKDGKVYFEQMTAVFENDNSKDEFGTASSPRFYYYFQKPKNSIPSGITQTLQAKNPGLCNYFKYNPQLSENNTIFILSQNAIRAAFFTEDIEDVESWVANKTISVIYPIVKQEPIEITGYLADKILEIDKSKNITIYSDNGVYGIVET